MTGPPWVTGRADHAAAPWHFLYFFPLPHGQGSLRPTFGSSRRTVFTLASSPPTRGGCMSRSPEDGADAGPAALSAPNGDGDAAAGLFRIRGDRRGCCRRVCGTSSASIG